jgi:hypothetical protein
MRILLALTALLFVPAVCYAHSGTVARAVANYLPFFLPLLSGLLYACRNYLRRLLFWKKK